MQKTTLTKILQADLELFLQTHKLPAHQVKTLKQYRVCRTAALGGHSQYCENGHKMGVWYNSCKRRGCPQCQSLPTERWLNYQRQRLLDTTHHHWIFTLPHQFLDLWRYNRVLLQNALYSAVAETLQLLARDARYLNARPAFLLTLHTWGRNLSLHPHIHCLIADGGLDEAGDWAAPQKKCLFPAKVMSQLVRGKFLAYLRAADTVKLPPDLAANHYRRLLNKLGRIDWVVYCCKPYRHGKGVVTYLSRYVKRGAVKNSQLRHHKGQVTLGYQSHRTNSRQILKLDSNAFILRLSDHIPLRGKPTFRYYGLYHPCCRKALDQARSHLGQRIVTTTTPITCEAYVENFPNKPVCPICNAPAMASISEAKSRASS
jgi:hypothetical protein